MKLTPAEVIAVREALHAGSACSNVCYNLAQNPRVAEGEQQLMKEAFERWDQAATILSALVKAETVVPERKAA